MECNAEQGAMGSPEGLLACNAPLAVVATATPSRTTNSKLFRLKFNAFVEVKICWVFI
jgi:hypothetical protein